MLLLTAQVTDTKPCYYIVDALRRSTAAYKSSTSTNPDPITLACLQAAELGLHTQHPASSPARQRARVQQSGQFSTAGRWSVFTRRRQWSAVAPGYAWFHGPE